MFHIGIVQYVISPALKGSISADSSVQAVVRMWDDNLLILGVDRKLSKHLRNGNYVIADYTPMAANSGNRKLSITKVLPAEEGSRIWTDFKDEFQRRSAQVQPRYQR